MLIYYSRRYYTFYDITEDDLILIKDFIKDKDSLLREYGSYIKELQQNTTDIMEKVEVYKLWFNEEIDNLHFKLRFGEYFYNYPNHEIDYEDDAGIDSEDNNFIDGSGI